MNPDTWYVRTKKQQLSFIGNRMGILCYANIALAIMFSGRNTPLLWITGRSRTEILTFHRWVARVAAIEGIIQAVLYWTNTNTQGYNMYTLAAGMHTVNYNQAYWTAGIIAVICLGLMAFVFSTLLVRFYLYEIFLLIHIGLGIAILVGLWEHVDLRFHKAYGYEVWLYIAVSFWGFDRVIRPLRIVTLNWKSWLSRDHPLGIVELLPGDVFVKVTVFPSIIWDFSAGQHCFLYFPTVNPFQSHPFSIALWNDGTRPERITSSSNDPSDTEHGPPSTNSTEQMIELQEVPLETAPAPAITSKPSISFIIRPEGGLTRHIYNRLSNDGKKRISAKFPVLVEGPYGSAPKTKFQSADTIIAVAGGIGITSLLGYLELYLSGEKKKATRFCLFWSVREESLIRAIKSQLGDLEALRRKGVEITITCTEEGDEQSRRMDVGAVVRGEVMSEGKVGRKACVVSCGPGGMADEVRKAVVGSIGKMGVSVELVEEAFCW
jgi:predicted ferric reductase